MDRGSRLQIKTVNDSKAHDPYRGGAFTLEFEVSDDGSFEEKLAGRVRIGQLLDDAPLGDFLRIRNSLSRRLEPPPAEHLALIPPSLHSAYSKPFHETASWEHPHDIWMRFRTAEDLAEWCTIIVAELPLIVERARSIRAGELLLGKRPAW